MRCLSIVKKGKVEEMELEKPTCTDEDTALIKNIYSGMSNGTERNVLMGRSYWPPITGNSSYPVSFNYQSIGEVVECGNNIKKYKKGDILYVGTFPGYTEYYLLREDDLAIKLPENFNLLEASLLGAVSVPFHDAIRAGVNVHDNVLVYGAGLIGQFASQAARVLGAIVTVVDINNERLRYAKKLGADKVIDVSSEKGKVTLESNVPYTVIFETTGVNVLDYIIGTGFGSKSLLGYRSRLICTAGRSKVTYNHNAAEEKEIALLNVHHFDYTDLENTIRLIAKGYIKVEPLITRVVPVSEGPKVFDILRDNPEKLLGTVIDWRI